LIYSGFIADPVGSGYLMREIRGIYMHGMVTVKGKDEIFSIYSLSMRKIISSKAVQKCTDARRANPEK
jgi:hypothetical protein